MSDDLVKRLRSGNTGQQTWIGLCEDAADRIEALTAALAKADAVSNALESLMNEAEVYERFNLNEDTETLTAYRQARDATR